MPLRRAAHVMLTRNASGLAGVVIIYQCIPLELYGPNIRSAERLSRLPRVHLPGEDCPEVDDLAPAPVIICADRGNLGARRRTFGSCVIRVDAPVGARHRSARVAPIQIRHRPNWGFFGFPSWISFRLRPVR